MSNWKRISFVWLRVKTGIWIKEEEDLARFESNNTFFDDFRFKRESLKSIIGTISRMKRAFGRKGKKAQLSITFFINRYPTSSISSTNGNTMDALEKNQTKLSSFRWISRFTTLWVDFLSGDVKKKNGEEFLYYFGRFTIVFCARAFLRYRKEARFAVEDIFIASLFPFLEYYSWNILQF